MQDLLEGGGIGIKKQGVIRGSDSTGFGLGLADRVEGGGESVSAGVLGCQNV